MNEYKIDFHCPYCGVGGSVGNSVMKDVKYKCTTCGSEYLVGVKLGLTRREVNEFDNDNYRNQH